MSVSSVQVFEPFTSLPMTQLIFNGTNVTAFTDSAANTAIVLTTVNLGAIKNFMFLWNWQVSGSAHLSAQTLATTWQVQVAVRDKTLQPAVTVAQFIASTTPAANVTTFAGGVTPPDVGNGRLFITPTLYNSFSGKDDYNNFLVSGDSLVLDLGVFLTQNKANQAGTFNASAWFSVMFP